MCIAQGNNTVPPVRLKLATLPYLVKKFTTKPQWLSGKFLTRAGKVVIKFPKIISYIIICYY